MEEILSRSVEEGITQEELLRSQNKVLARLVRAAERSRGRLFSIGQEWIQNRVYCPISTDIEKVRAITVDTMNRLLREYPVTPKLSVAVGPLSDPF